MTDILLPVDRTEGDVDARGGEGGAFHVAALVIEEDVRAQHLQDGPLVDASEEEGIVDAQAPLPNRVNRTLVSGGTTRRHDGDADPTPVPLRIIHTF